MSYLLPVTAAEIETLLDAVNSLPDDYYDHVTSTGLVARLRAGRDLNAMPIDQLLRHAGLGRAERRPQG
jgi:hypothetical protein